MKGKVENYFAKIIPLMSVIVGLAMVTVRLLLIYLRGLNMWPLSYNLMLAIFIMSTILLCFGIGLFIFTTPQHPTGSPNYKLTIITSVIISFPLWIAFSTASELFW